MASKWKRSSEALIAQFHETMEDYSEVQMKKMFGYPCTFINGNMCTGLHEENWIVRLSEKDREEIMETHGASQFAPMEGRVMREYVALPESIKSNGELLAIWVEKSIAFTSSLPLKIPKKRKKARG